jgi:hypothetical protein
MTTMLQQLLCSLAFLVSLAHGLDVRLSEYSCDRNLPVTADIYMQCQDGGTRCSFGDYVLIYGSRTCIHSLVCVSLS